MNLYEVRAILRYKNETITVTAHENFAKQKVEEALKEFNVVILTTWKDGKRVKSERFRKAKS